MMAVQGIKAAADRMKLEEHIPLGTPLRVYIDLASVCNFHCQFCPHGNPDALKEMPQAIMDNALAKKCIDDLVAFPQKIKILSLYNLGEPLLNKNISEIINYAASKNVAEEIHITTNASLLTHKLSEDMIHAGITYIDISIYGVDSESYKEFCGVTIDFESIVHEIEYLYSIKRNAKIVIKITDSAFALTSQDKENTARTRFLEIFSPICDKVCIERAVPLWHGLSEGAESIKKNIYGECVGKKEVCPAPFITMCVNSNGIVTPCCTNWNNTLKMGDAKKEPLLSIWTGRQYRNLYKKMLQTGGTKNIPTCSSCQWPEVVSIDNIDLYREVLLEKIREENHERI